MRDRSAELLAPPADFHDLETLVRGRIREMIDEILARPEHQWFELERKPREEPPRSEIEEAQAAAGESSNVNRST